MMSRRLRALVLGLLGPLVMLPHAVPSRADAPPPLPRPILRTLDNGLRVAVIPIHRRPIVQVQLLVPGGQVSEPPGAAGAAFLTAQLLTRGTSSRDADEFAAGVARLGASISASASRDYATLTGAFLARDLGAGLELMSDAALNPVFADDDVQATRADAARTLQRVRRDPGSLAEEQVWNALFGNRPYGRSPLGNDSSLASITREQVRLFHRDHYRPDRAMLVIAGDVEPDSALALAGEWFARWSGHAVVPAAPATPAPPQHPRVRVVDFPDAPYSVLRLGLLLPGRHSEDDVPLTLAATEFAGGAFSRLQRASVSQRLGATATGSLLTLRDGGVFSFGAPVRTDSAAAMVEVLREELRAFVQHPPTEREMPAIHRSSLGGFLAPLETLGGVIGQWAGMAFLDLPADAMSRTADRLATLRADEIGAAATRWFDADHVAIVAVGPAKILAPALARFGTVEVVQPLVPPAPIVVSDTVAATPENLAKGRQIADQALEAHGGLEVLRGIHDSVIEQKVEFGTNAMGSVGTIQQMRKEPNRLVSITRFRDVESRQVLNGNQAWSMTGSDLVDADSLQTAGLHVSFQSDLPHLLLPLRQDGVQVVARGTDRIEQRNVDALDVRMSDGQRRRYYFELTTHRLAAIDYFEGPGASGRRSRRLYGGYQTIDRAVWPFREERQLDGQRSMRIEITSVKVNIGIADREFEKPQMPPR